MKWTLGLAAGTFVLGAWAGFRAYGSASLESQFLTGMAIFIGCNLLFGSWVWYRAKPESGDRMVLPGVMLMSAVMLINILPRLFWPAAERLHVAMGILSVALSAIVLIMQIRRRAQRQSGPTL